MKALKNILIAFGIIGLLLAIVVALVIRDYTSFYRFIVHANDEMALLGGGLTNGRRSAEGDVHAWSHDPVFDGAKLTRAMAILRTMDQDNRIMAIYIDLRDAGIRDADLSIIHGL